MASIYRFAFNLSDSGQRFLLSTLPLLHAQATLQFVHLSQNSKASVQTMGIELDNWPIGRNVAEQMDYYYRGPI